MANIVVTAKIKYLVVKMDGHKEVEQHFEDFQQKITISEDNFTLLKAALSGTIDAADGATE